MEHEDAGKLCERLWTELSPCQINCDTQKGLLTLHWATQPVSTFASVAEWKETLDETIGSGSQVTMYNAYALHSSEWQDGDLKRNDHVTLSIPESCSIVVIPNLIGKPNPQSRCMEIGKSVEVSWGQKICKADFLIGPGDDDYFSDPGHNSAWMLDRIRPFHLASYNNAATGGDGAVSDAKSTTDRNITIL